MNFLIDYWAVMLGLIALGIMIGFAICAFVKEPSEEQKEQIKAFLRYAMYQAEKELGSKTGELKLSKVYNMFVASMPWIARLISFDQFAEYVKESMEWLEKKLEEENDNK